MKIDFYVKKYLKGHGESFNQIYELTKKDVYLSIYIYIKDKSTIEDLFQDTYMKIIDSIDKYELGTNFNAWVSKIARNIAINYYNKMKKIEVKDPIEDNVVFDKVVRKTSVDYYLSCLVGEDKDIFILRIMLGYKFEDIDNILVYKKNGSYYKYKKLIEKLKKF